MVPNRATHHKYRTVSLHYFRDCNSNMYLEKLFENTTIDWSKIYLLQHLVTIDTTLHSFLNNVFILNKKLYTFEVKNNVLCSFCKTLEETPMHIYYECICYAPICNNCPNL